MLTDKSLTLYNLSQKSSINVISMGHSLYIIDLMNIGLNFFWGERVHSLLSDLSYYVFIRLSSTHRRNVI